MKLNLASVPWSEVKVIQLYPTLQPPVPWQQIKSQSFDWSRKEKFYHFARQIRPQGANSLKTVSPDLERGSKEFYSNGLKRVWSAPGHSSDQLVMRYVGVGVTNFWLQLVWSLPMGSIHLTSPTYWGFQYLQTRSKILLGISLEGETGPCPQAALLFPLTIHPLSLNPLPSLISDDLNLPFGPRESHGG